MREFVVTESAGQTVAGRRNPGAGESVWLTESQAEHPLRIGHICRKAVEIEKPVAPKRRRRRRK